MNDRSFQAPRSLIFALIMLAWSTNALAQPPGCPTGFQSILISGQPEVPFTDYLGSPVAMGQVCFNPTDNCYLALFDPSGSVMIGSERIPFMAMPNGSDLMIYSMARCGNFPDTRGKSFQFALADTTGNGCFDSLSIDNNGDMSSGMLVGDGSVNIMLDDGMSIMMDVPYVPSSVNPMYAAIGPAFHQGMQLSANVPTNSMGGVPISNGATGMPIGSVDGICGARLAAPRMTAVVPTLSRWGLLALCLGLLVATVWATRRRFEA